MVAVIDGRLVGGRVSDGQETAVNALCLAAPLPRAARTAIPHNTADRHGGPSDSESN